MIAALAGAILLGSGISLGIGISEIGEPPAPLQSSGFESSSSRGSEIFKPEISGPININTASALELESLPKIGPVLAKRIVEYRQANGPFKTTADIQNVSGIGPKIYAQFKDQITVK